MFNWKESLESTVTYVGKDGNMKEMKVKGAFVKLVYIYLLDCKNESPTYNEIAEDVELSRSIVIRCVKVLEEKGLLTKKIRPTHTRYHKSNVYTVHHDQEARSPRLDVQCTPKSLNTNTSISIDDRMQDFNKVNEKWNDCFQRDIYINEYLTLTKQTEVENLCEQIDKIRVGHHNVGSIVDAGKYVYTVIVRGGFEAVDKPRYVPSHPSRKPYAYSKQDKKVSGYCKAERDRREGKSVSRFTPEEVAQKQAEIARKIALLQEEVAV